MRAVTVDKTCTFGHGELLNFIIVAGKGTALIFEHISFCAGRFKWTIYFPERTLALRREQGGHTTVCL